MSYSIDVLKKSAFQHELMSVLDVIPLTERGEEWVAVKDYFVKRLKELDVATKR